MKEKPSKISEERLKVIRLHGGRKAHETRKENEKNPANKSRNLVNKNKGKEHPLLFLRFTLRMTQKELATAVSSSPESVANWETGRIFPSEENRRKLDELSRGFGKPLDWIAIEAISRKKS